MQVPLKVAVQEVKYFLEAGINERNCDHVEMTIAPHGEDAHPCFMEAMEKVKAIKASIAVQSN